VACSLLARNGNAKSLHVRRSDAETGAIAVSEFAYIGIASGRPEKRTWLAQVQVRNSTAGGSCMTAGDDWQVQGLDGDEDLDIGGIGRAAQD
jgi:hypothetical protein